MYQPGDVPNQAGGGGGTYELGMDIAKVEDIMSQLTTAKKELAEAKEKSDSAAGKLKSAWGGADANRFQSAWPKHSAQIDDAIQSVNAMVTKGRKNIEEQRQASA